MENGTNSSQNGAEKHTQGNPEMEEQRLGVSSGLFSQEDDSSTRATADKATADKATADKATADKANADNAFENHHSDGHSNEEGCSKKDSPELSLPDNSEPWGFLPQWPLTRAQRISELEKMAPFYESLSPEKENIAAAINWHAQFPADQMAPAALTFFQKGEKVDQSQLSLEFGQPWIEGCDVDYMTGHGPPQPTTMQVADPSSITGTTGHTYYTRDSDTHMYEV